MFIILIITIIVCGTILCVYGIDDEIPPKIGYPKLKSKYNYDISNMPTRNDLSLEKDKFRLDIYGLHGNDYKNLAIEERNEARNWARSLTKEQILNQNLSKLHPEICWCLYHEL